MFILLNSSSFSTASSTAFTGTASICLSMPAWFSYLEYHLRLAKSSHINYYKFV